MKQDERKLKTLQLDMIHFLLENPIFSSHLLDHLLDGNFWFTHAYVT